MRIKGYDIPGVEWFREPGGLWVAQMRGVQAYGKSLADAVTNVRAWVQRVVADRAEHGE